MKYVLLLMLTSVTLSACSNHDLYQAGQSIKQSKCINEAVSEAEHQACLNAEKKSYKQYEAERNEVIKQKP